MASRWSISVNGSGRVTFEFRDGNAYVLEYEDYPRSGTFACSLAGILPV